MTQSLENPNIVDKIISFYLKIGINKFAFVLLTIFISIAHDRLLSKDYWDFILYKLNELSQLIYSMLAKDIFTSLTVFFIIFLAFKTFKPKSWLDKVQYSQKEQLNFYVSQLLEEGSNIKTKEDLNNFCIDVVESLHNVFAQKCNKNNTTWLIPSGEFLVLFHTNKFSKYKNSSDHFSFKTGEGVAGSSWAKGEIELYSEKQENKLYKNRNQCGDRSYICCPVANEPENKYGILAVGADNDIYWKDEDKESLRLFSIVVKKILNDIDNEIKAQLNL